uniref:Reverse transcriptase domain-containing protein n=1 Tax=Tanacetum cinerariifolium TaxID=118510 RepID=A0A6L2L2U8_TANCI|nr:hypothetical protein [Tanacetum cinerariifolium]
MGTQAEPIPTPPKFAVQNTVGKGNEETLENPNRPESDAALLEYYDNYYHQLLRIIAEKFNKEKEYQDKLKEVKAHLNFEGCLGRNSKIQEVSQHYKLRTPNIKGEPGRRQRFRRSRSMYKSPEPTPSVFSRIRRDRSKSPRHRLGVKGRREGGVFNRLSVKGRSVSAHSESRYQSSHSRKMKPIPRKR